jgi:rod shape-determining protein MreD
MSRISWLTVYPNLLVIITSLFGFMRGQKDGILVGFLSGLLMDVFFDSVLGFYMLIYMAIGFINGYFQRLFYDDDVTLPIFFVAASDFMYGIVVYFIRFLLQSDFHFQYYLIHIIVPEVVFTGLVTIVVYRMILFINRKIETIEKRSAGKFV